MAKIVKKYRSPSPTQDDDNFKNQSKSKVEKELPGYPLYSPDEDIFNTDTETESVQEQDDNSMGLDVPGSELDDEQEDVGSEDEENNYYSLGGDDHEDLDEDQGD